MHRGTPLNPAKTQRISWSWPVFRQTPDENQRGTKRVESRLVRCLDGGSSPPISTVYSRGSTPLYPAACRPESVLQEFCGATDLYTPSVQRNILSSFCNSMRAMSGTASSGWVDSAPFPNPYTGLSGLSSDAPLRHFAVHSRGCRRNGRWLQYSPRCSP